MNDLFNSLDSGEVISIQQDAQVLVGHRIFRVSELNEAIANYLKTSVGNWTEDKSDWFTTQGINCEALRFGSNAWQKGRIRLCLEFCPDEVSPAASRAVTNSTPVGSTPVQVAPTAAPVAPVAAPSPIASTSIPAVTQAIAAPTTPSIAVTTTSTVEATNHSAPVSVTTIPVAEIATVGAGVTVMAAAVTTAAATIKTVETPNVAKVVAANSAPIPAIADVVLEADDKPTVTSREGLDEIAFDFDVSSDNLGTMVPNGMMELDLTDLDLDRAENDYLDFENSALADPTLEFNPIQSIDKSENSGMLIDEVWNEMSQPNWPGIH